MKLLLKIILFFLPCFAFQVQAQILDLSPGLNHVQLGDNKMRINDWEGAVLEYSTAIRVDPNLADAFYKRSIVYTKMARFREADEDRQKALLMNPKIEKFYDERAILAMTVIDYGNAIGDFTEAFIFESLFPQIVESFDSSDKALFLRKAVLDELNQYLQNNKKDTAATLQRARLQMEAGNFEAALADANMFIKPGDKNAKAFEIRGTVQIQLGNYAYALDEFSKSLELDPYCGTTFFNRGIARLILNDLTGALSDFQRVEQISPEIWQAAYNAGLIQMKRERFDDASREFDKAVRIRSNVGYIYFYRGLARYKNAAFQGAFDDFDRSWQLGEYRKESLNNKAVIHLYFNEKKEAVSNFSDAMREYEDYATALYNRGLAYIMSALRLKACQDLNQSMGLDFLPAMEAAIDFCK